MRRILQLALQIKAAAAVLGPLLVSGLTVLLVVLVEPAPGTCWRPQSRK
jgi:hypothetical protein